MATELDIVNTAAIRAGLDPLTSLTQPGKTARVASISFPMLRDALLREYRWNFTVTRVMLSADGEDAFQSTRTFLLPADNARVIAVFDLRYGSTLSAQNYRNYTDGRLAWKVEGGKLLAPAGQVALIYQRRTVPVGEWDATFNEVLACRLSADLALACSGDEGKHDRLRLRARDALLTARRSNAFETTPEVVVASEWVDSRFTGAPYPFVQVP